MLEPRKRSPTESPLPFTLDPTPIEETLTTFGGVPLVVQAFRSLGLPGAVMREVQTKARQRGYDEATFVESFVVLQAVRGECLDDFDWLRADPGLAGLLGHAVPSLEAAREFLYAFHDETLIGAAQAARGSEQVAYMPEEDAPLCGLGRVNRALVQQVGRRCPDQRIATVDQDATLIESRNQAALRSYEGERGYQPMLAVWADMKLVLADEFCDGNVPALSWPLAVAKAAFAALPPTVTTYYYRADSACHDWSLIHWLRHEAREAGPLHAAIRALPAEAWQPYGQAHPEEMRECAEVAFISNEPGA